MKRNRFLLSYIIRPLHHPSIDLVTLTGLLHALSDPVRLAIVAELRKTERGLNCVETREKLDLNMPKSTCSQHYRIMREAGLILCERRGVELTSTLRRRELETRFPGLLDAILKAWRREQEG